MRNAGHLPMSGDGGRLARVDSLRSGVDGVPVSACVSIIRGWIAAEIMVLVIVVLVRLAT